MSSLPRVTESTRERVAREFDDLGPDACMAEIIRGFEQDNPELLDMACKCARDVGNTSEIMVGFGIFYRLLVAESPIGTGKSLLSPLPRVTPETRDLLVHEIDRKGPEAFTRETVEVLERSNPELLQMAHRFAADSRDYLGLMQGFALLYRSLLFQSAADRMLLH